MTYNVFSGTLKPYSINPDQVWFHHLSGYAAIMALSPDECSHDIWIHILSWHFDAFAHLSLKNLSAKRCLTQ